ncbi:DUF2919 domain-containing protein [Klebsiella pneumoniae subsp. pneumoniae]|nr:DUF2919 domain-containing protein [Klebsiella pneumoniae subsp. pneumoniae]
MRAQLLLQRPRSVVLFLMAGASRQQGDARFLICSIPITSASGGLPGVPAVLAFLLSGYRQRLPRLWRAMRRLLRAIGALTAAVAADAMAERRIPSLVDHCAAGRGWLMPCGGC